MLHWSLIGNDFYKSVSVRSLILFSITAWVFPIFLIGFMEYLLKMKTLAVSQYPLVIIEFDAIGSQTFPPKPVMTRFALSLEVARLCS